MAHNSTTNISTSPSTLGNSIQDSITATADVPPEPSNDIANKILCAKEIQDEKNLLPILNNASTKRLLHKKVTKDWINFFLYIDLTKLFVLIEKDKLIEAPNEKIIKSEFEGFNKIMKKGCSKDTMTHFSYLICKECFLNKETCLRNCVFGCSHISISNYGNHLSTHHLHKTIAAYRNAKFPSNTNRNSSSATVSLCKTNPLGFVVMASKKRDTAKMAIDNAHTKMYNFVNDSNCSAQTVMKPVFREMIEAVRLAAIYCSGSELVIGKQKYTNLQVTSLTDTVHSIAQLISRARAFYVSVTGNTVGFLCLCHDIWDSKLKEMLGLALAFIDPIDCIYYQIPVGLIETRNKTAPHVKEESLQVLARYNIHQTDLYRPMNDNTNCALAAGRLIVNTTVNGRCGMHESDLITKHATGQVVRKRNHVIIDSNPACEDFRKKLRAIVKWLVDKKNKNRYSDYQQYCLKVFQYQSIKLSLPNKTRVAGTILMYHDVLRSFHALRNYFESETSPNSFTALRLSSLEWDQVAQYSAILDPIYSLSISLQTNRPGAIAISFVQIGLALYTLKQLQTTEFCEVVETRHPEEHRWGPHQGYSSLPTSKRYYCQRACDYGIGKFLSKDSCHLVDRLINETSSYFQNRKERDRDIAVMCHPLTAVQSLDLLEVIEWLVPGDKELYKTIITDTVFNFHRKTLSETGTTADDQNSTCNNQDSEDDGDDNNIFEKLRKKRRLISTESLPTSIPVTEARVNAATRKDAKEQVKAYLLYMEDVNWDSLITKWLTDDGREYHAKMAKCSIKKKDWKKWCRRKDIISLWRFFDVLAWWNIVGRSTYPLMFPVACVSLGKPFTNAEQERNFSMASWFNGNLTQSAHGTTFETRYIEAINRKVVIKCESTLKNHQDTHPTQDQTVDEKIMALTQFLKPPPVTAPEGSVARLFNQTGDVVGPTADEIELDMEMNLNDIISVNDTIESDNEGWGNSDDEEGSMQLQETVAEQQEFCAQVVQRYRQSLLSLSPATASTANSTISTIP
jgi:hypothetical protein